MTTRPICVYHANCVDGFAAAWVVKKAFHSVVDFHPGIYGEPPPDVSGRDVVLVDFVVSLVDDLPNRGSLDYTNRELDPGAKGVGFDLQIIEVRHVPQGLRITCDRRVRAGVTPAELHRGSHVVWIDAARSNIRALAEAFDPDMMDAALLLAPTSGSVGVDWGGDFDLDAEGRIIRRDGQKPFVYTGVGVMKPQLFAGVADDVFKLAPFFFEAAILSRMRSAVTSRSNWAKDNSMFSVSRPMLVAVLKDWVTETKETSSR